MIVLGIHSGINIQLYSQQVQNQIKNEKKRYTIKLTVNDHKDNVT